MPKTVPSRPPRRGRRSNRPRIDPAVEAKRIENAAKMRAVHSAALRPAGRPGAQS